MRILNAKMLYFENTGTEILWVRATKLNLSVVKLGEINDIHFSPGELPLFGKTFETNKITIC